MKKTLAILLSLMIAAGAFASCGKKNEEKDNIPSDAITETEGTKDEAKTEDEEKTESADTSAFTAEGIINSIYAQKSPEFMYGFVPVDMTDKDSYMTYLGVEDISKIKEAAVSESMIGAQAYSLVVARVAEGVDAKAVAEEMEAGINPRKWICVNADDVKVTTIGDLICFCMISSDFKEAFTAEDAMNAFTKVVNGEADYLAENEAFEDEAAEGEEATEETEEETTEEVTEETTEEKPAEAPAVTPEVTPSVTPVVTPVVTPSVTPEVAPEEKAEESTSSTDKYTLQGIIDSIYAQKAPLFMFGSMPVDLEDEFSYNTYLGLKDASKISEAVVSESMIGAQAYSLVIARVKDGVDAKAVASEMKAGINPRKWICVEADDVKVTSYEDLICFCMISTEYKDAITANDVTTAFTNIMTGKAVYEEGAMPNIPGMDMEEEEVEDDFSDEVFAEVDADTEVVGGSALETIVSDMYAIKAPLFRFGIMPVDLTDEFAVSSYLGLSDASKIAEAVFSESMMGSQAYSLVVARVAPGADAKAVANEMKAGIDPAKWICVEADDVKVTTKGDLICFCMISTEFAPDYTAQDAIDAFNKVA
ncbi:MAG: hypothetical protein IKU43_06900 [Clostridia bacterium]|nr:hypothetical protein [Clostridia bacterium]